MWRNYRGSTIAISKLRGSKNGFLRWQHRRLFKILGVENGLNYGSYDEFHRTQSHFQNPEIFFFKNWDLYEATVGRMKGFIGGSPGVYQNIELQNNNNLKHTKSWKSKSGKLKSWKCTRPESPRFLSFIWCPFNIIRFYLKQNQNENSILWT
jgi:hypothetical protein